MPSISLGFDLLTLPHTNTVIRMIISFKKSVTGALLVLTVLALVASGCGNDDDGGSGGADELPTILTTTSIWADVVANVTCNGLADVVTLIPPGGDPHAFQPSMQDRARMDAAALIVANGLDLEGGPAGHHRSGRGLRHPGVPHD